MCFEKVTIHAESGDNRSMKICKRLDLKTCPYRELDINFQHWVVKCGKSYEFAKERATVLCRSVPCMYYMETLIERYALREKEKENNGLKEIV